MLGGAMAIVNSAMMVFFRDLICQNSVEIVQQYLMYLALADPITVRHGSALGVPAASNKRKRKNACSVLQELRIDRQLLACESPKQKQSRISTSHSRSLSCRPRAHLRCPCGQSAASCSIWSVRCPCSLSAASCSVNGVTAAEWRWRQATCSSWRLSWTRTLTCGASCLAMQQLGQTT